MSGHHQQTARPRRMIRPFLMMIWMTFGVVVMMMMPFGTVAAGTAATTSHIEPKTGIAFLERYKRMKLNKLGVRSKGPLKVYAVGLYGQSLFVLKMKMSVTAEKISGALADALKPRCLQHRQADGHGASRATSTTRRIETRLRWSCCPQPGPPQEPHPLQEGLKRGCAVEAEGPGHPH